MLTIVDMMKMTTMTDNIRGIGNDIIEIDRIRDSFSYYGDKILNRLLTLKEKQYCLSMHDPAIRFAGRFVAKEAISKALGCGIGQQLGWHDMEILNDSAGRPLVTFSPEANSRLGSPHILLSISHCRLYATAVALYLKDTADNI